MIETHRNGIKVALINNYSEGSGLERIPRLKHIFKLFPATFDEIQYHDLPVSERLNQEYDCVILSGSVMNISKPDHRQKMEAEIRLIRDIKIPVLGICFGLHLAAHAFGAKVEYNENSKERNTEIPIDIKNDPEKLIGVDRHTVNVWHKDYISPSDQKFLKLFEVRATSDDGRFKYVQYAKHKERPLFCVQFHPECFDDTDEAVRMDGERIIHNFLRFAKGESNVAVR